MSVSLGEHTLAWVFQRLPVTQRAGITASGIVGGNAFELPSLWFDPEHLHPGWYLSKSIMTVQ